MFISLYIKKNFAEKIYVILLSLTLIGFLCVLGIYAFAKNNSAENKNCVEVPIIMYHGITKNVKKQNKFMIDPKLFESDIKYIKENNITAVFVKDLVNFAEGKADLPEKCILLTFDDGYYNNYLYAYSLAKKYDCKIIISPIGKCVDEYSKIKDENEFYSYLTWPQIEEMAKSGLVEIQNHSYDMHSKGKGFIGCKKIKNESVSKYEERLTKDVQKQQNLIIEHTGVQPLAFVYPFGAFSNETPNILKKMGFKATFICYDKINTITRNPNCLDGLCRFIRPNNVSSKEFFSKIFRT